MIPHLTIQDPYDEHISEDNEKAEDHDQSMFSFTFNKEEGQPGITEEQKQRQNNSLQHDDSKSERQHPRINEYKHQPASRTPQLKIIPGAASGELGPTLYQGRIEPF